MWQFFALGALVFSAAETTADKIIMVADRSLDTLVSSFYRNFIFFILSFAIGLSGLAGALQFRFEWPLLAVIFLELIGSIFYTILLKRVEMTGAAAIGYIGPFLFLLADLFIFKASLDFLQIFGILLLIGGGVLFVIDPRTRRLKRQYSKYIVAILMLDIVISGVQYYVFKYYSAGEGLNEISYLVNVWFWVAAGLFLVTVFAKKWRLLFRTAAHKRYLQKTLISKSFDVGGALLWFHAISLAAVSQVNSLSAFEPLILLVVLFVAQQVFKFKADEDFSKVSVFQKIAATLILVVGAWLAA